MRRGQRKWTDRGEEEWLGGGRKVFWGGDGNEDGCDHGKPNTVGKFSEKGFDFKTVDAEENELRNTRRLGVDPKAGREVSPLTRLQITDDVVGQRPQVSTCGVRASGGCGGGVQSRSSNSVGLTDVLACKVLLFINFLLRRSLSPTPVRSSSLRAPGPRGAVDGERRCSH